MKIAFYTLGCKVNSYETASIIKLFKEANYEIVLFEENADIYVINTCSVTNMADQKNRKIIKKAIHQNPDAIICVMGCYTQTNPKEVEGIVGVDIIIGNNNKKQIVELVEEFLLHQQKITKVLKRHEMQEFEVLETNDFELTRAYLKIQDGCDNFCSYCIIPYARGKVRSRSKEDVLAQIQQITANHYQEVVLAGIHTGAYGKELGNYHLSDLIEDIIGLGVLYRLRISSIEINEVDEKLLKFIKEEKVIANHLHLPLQSGEDSILKMMNRKYDTAEYLSKIEKIRQYIPDIAITTDVIVGFPGETEEHFLKTYAFIQQIGFAKLHVFPYSKRLNTPASTMINQVPKDVKSLRVKKLLELSKTLETAYALKFLNKELEMIVETSEENCSYGHTSNYLKVMVPTTLKINSIVKIQIVKVTEMSIIGEKI